MAANAVKRFGRGDRPGGDSAAGVRAATMDHTSRSARRRTARSHARQAVARCVEALESRVLLSGAIQVTVLSDTNGNGTNDAGDAPLSGWTVYIDADKNGALDPIEARAVT